MQIERDMGTERSGGRLRGPKANGRIPVILAGHPCLGSQPRVDVLMGTLTVAKQACMETPG